MKNGLTFLEVLGLAIRSEEDAAKFYGHISRMIRNETVREKYRTLAAEEAGHRQALVQLYLKESGDVSPPPRIPGDPETAEGGPVPEDIADSLEDLLDLAVEREREAQSFYKIAAARAADLSGRRLLEYLADVERGHEETLRKEREAYLRHRQWYTGEGEPEMIHVGP